MRTWRETQLLHFQSYENFPIFLFFIFLHEFPYFCMNVQNGDGSLKLIFPCFMHSIHLEIPLKHN